jgi:flagellar biogenesis protein FliO
MESLQQIGAILLVLGLLGSALYFLKKKKLAGFDAGLRGGHRLHVLERVSLGPQHTLCLVRVDERIVMVSTSPASCQVSELPSSALPSSVLPTEMEPKC